MHDKRYHGTPEGLRSPERLKRLQIDSVVTLTMHGVAPLSLLDVGTGAGIFAEAFCAAGLRVAGVDINPDMISEARLHVPAAEFTVAPADRLPCRDDSFDIVFMGFLLHEMDEPATVLAEALRVSRLRTVVLEWPHRQEDFGPPLEHRLPGEKIGQLADHAGFSTFETHQLNHVMLYRMDK